VGAVDAEEGRRRREGRGRRGRGLGRARLTAAGQPARGWYATMAHAKAAHANAAVRQQRGRDVRAGGCKGVRPRGSGGWPAHPRGSTIASPSTEARKPAPWATSSPRRRRRGRLQGLGRRGRRGAPAIRSTSGCRRADSCARESACCTSEAPRKRTEVSGAASWAAEHRPGWRRGILGGRGRRRHDCRVGESGNRDVGLGEHGRRAPWKPQM
jgi:hypothetical protein